MKEIGLYIHIPFCKQKCRYCDFPSYSGKESLEERYVLALSKEIKEKTKDHIVKSIFVGGGTPSYLGLKDLKILLKTISELKFKEQCEFTMECNPGTLDMEKLTLMKEMGVNRLSIGLQSCDDELLNILGRIHNFHTFKENYNLAKKVGFNNINVDLMFGLPNQDIHQWKNTLNTIIDLDPEHVSCYGLIIEEGTAFYKLNEKNELMLPEEGVERQMYYYAVNALKKNGYEQYEISNFSKKNYECKHNLIYWNLGDYIGCGSASHSYHEGFRYRNEENIEEYILKIEKNNSAIVEKIKNEIKDDIEEFMFLGLRKIEGISTEEFYKKFNCSVYYFYGKIIEKYKKLQFMEEKNKKLYLTSKGIELSNIIMADFLL